MHCRSRSYSFILLIAFLAAAVGGLEFSAQAPNPLIGTWILNVEKSRYDPGRSPKSEIRTFDYSNQGMILSTIQRVTAQGKPHLQSLGRLIGWRVLAGVLESDGRGNHRLDFAEASR